MERYEGPSTRVCVFWPRGWLILGGCVNVKALVRWATGKWLTNRLPKLSLITTVYHTPVGRFSVLDIHSWNNVDAKQGGRLETSRRELSEGTMSILGDRWWPQKAKQGGYKVSKVLLCKIWKNAMSSRSWRCLLGVGTVLLRLERDAWSMVK